MAKPVERFDMTQSTCSIDGCESPTRARGWCMSHYNRWHAHGDPETGWAEAEACGHCGSAIPPKTATGPRSLYCSKTCRSRASYARRRDGVLAKHALGRQEFLLTLPRKACPCCGVEFLPENARRMYCSERCSKKIHNASRRARKHNAFVEHLHWRMLYDEDGPLCHICGYDVDPSDALGPAAPTLDHIVPLSRGGLHERSNAALAHRYCNSVKGDRPLSAVA